MDTTIIQIPISKEARDSAKVAALEAGFSSLQDMLRFLINKVSKREMIISVTESSAVQLSKRNAERYVKMTKDYKKRKNIQSFDSVDELMADLRS